MTLALWTIVIGGILYAITLSYAFRTQKRMEHEIYLARRELLHLHDKIVVLLNSTRGLKDQIHDLRYPPRDARGRFVK